MNTSKQEREGQRIADPEFAEKNRTIHAHFTKRLSSFTAFDANLHSGYADSWQKSIEDFEAVPPDSAMEAEVQGYTDAQAEQRKLCLAAVADVEYYTLRAFPDNAGKLREFGFHQTRSEKGGVLRMAINMAVMKKVADDFVAELTTAGMPAGILSNLETQTDLLVKTEINQEYQKRLRTRNTETRITFYNRMRQYYLRVRDCAKVIFRLQEETKKLFEMG